MSLDKTLLGIAKSAVDTQQKSRDGRNVVSKGVDAVTNKSYANEDKKVAAAALRKWENSTWKPKVEAKLKQELKTRAPHLKPGSKAYQQTYDSLFNKNYKDLQSAKAKAQQQIGTLRQKGQTQRQVDNEYSQKEASRNNTTRLQAASSAARDTGEAVSGALATGSSRALRYPLQLAADIGENDDGGIFDRGAKALERHEDNLQQVYPAYADIQQNGNFGQKLALSAVEQIPNLALSFTGAGAAAKGAQLAGAGAKMTAATAYGTAAATMYPQAYGDGNDSTKQELENATPEQLATAVRSKDIYKGHFDKNIKAGMSEDEAHQKSRDQTISSIAEESGDAVGLATLALSMLAPGVGSFTANRAAGGAVSKWGQKVFNKLAVKADAGKVAKYALPAAVGTGIVGLNVAEEALQEGYTDYKAQQAAVDVGVKDKINQSQNKEAMIMGGALGGLMGGGVYVGTRNSKFQQAQDGLREAQDTYAQAAAIIPQLQQQIETVSPRSPEGQTLTAQLEETKAALSAMATEAETRGIPKTSLARRAPRIDPTNSFDTDFNGQVDGATELSEQDFENALNPDGTPATQATPAAPVLSEQELDLQDAQIAEFIAEQAALDEAIEDGSNEKPVEQSLAEAQSWYDSKRGAGQEGLGGVVRRAEATEQDTAFAQQQEGIKGATASINDYIASERAKQQQIDAQLQQEAQAATTDAEKQAVAQKIEQRDAERAKEDDILDAREQLAQPYENELFDTTIIGADGAPFKLARFWDSSLPAGAKAKAIADAFGGQIDQNVAKSDWANLPEGVQKELHKWFTERLDGVRQSREGAVAQASEQVAELAVEQPQAVAPTASGLTMPVRAEQAPVEAEQGAASYTLDNLKDDINNNYGSDPQAMFDAQKRAEEAGLPQPEINRVIQETISEKVGWTKPVQQLAAEQDMTPPGVQAKIDSMPAPDNEGVIYRDGWRTNIEEARVAAYGHMQQGRLSNDDVRPYWDNDIDGLVKLIDSVRDKSGQPTSQLTDENPVINIPAPTQAKAETPAPTTDEGIYKSKPAAKAAIKKQKLDPDSVTINQVKGGGFEIVPNAPAKPSYAQAQEQAATELGMTINEDGEYGGTDAEFEVFANRVDEIQGRSLSNSTPTPQQSTTAPSNDAAIGKDGQAKWFGSNDKAQAFIDKKGISDTHEVVSAGKSRFEIQPKQTTGATNQTSTPIDVTSENGSPDTQELTATGRAKITGQEGWRGNLMKSRQLAKQLHDAGYMTGSEIDRAFADEANEMNNSIDNGLYRQQQAIKKAELEDVNRTKRYRREGIKDALMISGLTDAEKAKVKKAASTIYDVTYTKTTSSPKNNWESSSQEVAQHRATLEEIADKDLPNSYTQPEFKSAIDKAMSFILNDIKPTKTEAQYTDEDIKNADDRISKAGDNVGRIIREGESRKGELKDALAVQKTTITKDSKAANSAPAKRAEAKKAATEKTQNNVSEQEATPKKKTAAELRASLLDNNKIISKDKAEEYKKTLKSRLSQANTGFDVEAFVAASGLAVAYIEGGIRNFNDFATLLVDDVGVKVKKYLLPAWEGARAYDDLDTEGMTSTEDARAEFNALVADGFFDEAQAEPEQASEPVDPTLPSDEKAVQEVFGMPLSNVFNIVFKEAETLEIKAKRTRNQDDQAAANKAQRKARQDIMDVEQAVIDYAEHKITLGEFLDSKAGRFQDFIDAAYKDRDKQAGFSGNKQVTTEQASTPAKPLTLNQDWGVQKIDAYNVKTEFLKDAENYLNDVKDILKQKGYTSTVNNSGKPIKVVDTNQFGMQSSGAVQLTMQKDGVFVGVFIGNNDQTQNNSNHKQGIEIKVQSTPHEIWRLAQEFEWVDAKTTSQDLAKIIESHVAEKRKDKGANKSSTPAKSDVPKKVGSGTQAKTLIGENNEGLPLYEDDRGVRSILEHGIIYVNESVNITPTGIEQNPREQRYLTKEELAQENDNDTGTSNQDDRQHADGELSTADQADAESRNTGRAEAEPTSDVPNVDGRSNRSDTNDGDEAGQSAGKNKRTTSTDSRSGTGSAQSNDGANAKSNKSAAVKATDYAIPPRDENAKQPSWFEIGERNVEIIELVQQLENEGRHATPDEQALLADYKGWGSSKIEIFPHPTKGYSSPRWEALGEKLKSLLTDSEYATARRTTQYAHYTPPSIVNGIYAALEQFGFKGGQVFEPASGIGVFNGLMPRDMASKSHYVGVELDPMTALIAKHLYPLSDMTMGDYTKVKLPDNHFDVAVGNPPFADISYSYGAGKNKKPYLIHDYFFAKTLDKLKPGGVMAFVTSKGSMDKTNSGARESFAEQADLIGAIRLPNTAFKDEAGTAVVTDIIFLRKRMPDEASNGVKWTDTQEKTIDGEKVSINEYFVDNPNMVLGRNAITSGQFGPTYTVESDSNNLSGQIETAIAQLPKDIFKPARGSNAEAAKVAEIDYGVKSSQQREGGVYVKDGKLMKVIDGVGKPLTHRYGTNGKRIALTDPQIQFLTDYTGVRDAFKQSQQDQLNDNPNWQDSLDSLNTAYDSFVKKHGRLMAHTISTTERADGKEITTTRFANKAILFLDVDGYVASALENIVDGEVIGKDAVIEKGSYFKGRTLNKPKTPTIKTTQDALVYVLNEVGTPNIKQIAKLVNKSEQEVIADLGSQVFTNPETGAVEMAEIYLSGNVVEKLATAEAMAAKDNIYQKNVDALKDVQPKFIAPNDISSNLGSGWIPGEVIKQFSQEVLDANITANYSGAAGIWDVSGYSRNSDYQTPSKTTKELMDAILNSKPITVSYTVDGKSYTDAEKTELAEQMASKIQKAFKDWIWKDTERANTLAEYYNKNYNNIVPPTFNGDHLTLAGMSSKIKLRPHQKTGIYRVISQGDVYLNHAVGAGKTFTMIAAAMEEKRLGLINKPMFVVPNHMLAQFSQEFLMLYPAANIVVADEQNFHTHNRKQFVAEISVNNPDAIIITHTAFGKIGVKPETQKKFLENTLNDWREALLTAKSVKGEDNSQSVRQLERNIQTMETKLTDLLKAEAKDDTTFFEDMGVDKLIVDEMHEYRKLSYATRQGRIKGIVSSGSQMASDLQMKIELIREKNPTRAIVGASGTPVTNTMGELFSVQTYFQPKQLRKDGLHHFDNWSNQFGEVVKGLEQNAAGNYEVVPRFAKFLNVPELMSRVRWFMDVLTSDQLGDVVQRPDIVGGGRQIISVPAPDGFDEFQQGLADRITATRNRSGKPKKGDDNILKIINDGRFGAIDLRFVNPDLPSDPNSKLNRAIADMAKAYHDTANNEYHDGKGNVDELTGGAQMLFTNIGLGAQSAASTGFDMKAWINSELIRLGVEPDHIAFMADANSHAKKGKLFEDMRQGRKRILIGGSNMETGVNAQKRLTHLAHLDSPWYPATVEQREGRIIRQGNQNKEVVIRAYATKGSYDSTMWGMVARKARFIQQAMNGDISMRHMDDISEASAFEQASALSSGDPRALQLAGLAADVERLDRYYSAYENARIENSREAKRSRESAVRAERELSEVNKLLANHKSIETGGVIGKVGSKTFDNRQEFGEAIIKAFDKLKATQAQGEHVLGTASGYNVVYNGVMLGETFIADADISIPKSNDNVLFDNNSGEVSASGVATSIINRVNGLADYKSAIQKKIEGFKKDADNFERRASQSFENEVERKEKHAAYKELDDTLRAEAAAIKAQASGSNSARPLTDADRVPAKDEQPKFSRIAPNGKPSNLNDKQWLQVRTPAFKKWFGDWENDAANASKILDANGEPMVVYHGSSAKDIDIFRDSPQTNGLLFFTENKGDAVSYSNGEKSGYMDMEYAEDKANLDIARGYLIENGDSDMFNGALLSKNISDETKVSEFAGDSNIGLVEAIGDKLRAGKVSLSGAIDEINAFISSLYREGKVYGVFLNVTKPYNSKTNPVSWQEAEKMGSNKLSDSSDGIFVTEDDSDAAIAVYNPNQIKSADDNAGTFDASNPDIRYSKTNPAKGNTGTTSQQVITVLQNRFGKEVVASLVKSGKLRVRTLNDFVNADGRLLVPSDAEGFYYDGKVVLIADNLTADNAVATLLHEMGGHAGIQSMLDPQTYMSLMANFDALVKSGNKYAVRAKERAEASTDSDSEARDEYIPYLITEYAQASERGGAIGVIKRFVNRVMAGVRAWVRNHTGVQLKMTPNDITQLAERMVKRLAEQSAADMDIADVENMPAGQVQFSQDSVEQTDTPAFKKWFGDSKVIDKDGKPLAVYHGTIKAFNEFNTTDFGALLGKGSYFTVNKAEARQYSGQGTRIVPAYLSIENPYYVKSAMDNVPSREEMLSSGYDGVIQRNDDGSVKWAVAHKPTQIKSATDNAGTFDGSNPDIRFSRRYSNLGTDGKPVTGKEKALDKIALAQATTMSSKFGVNLLLRRHLATPQHVALLNPVFKLFTDNIQSRIAYENNEAGLVQTLLPEIWDTRLVVGKKKEAMERVSTAIFDGTMADQVWTDSELETKFNLTPEDIGFYRRARAAIDKSVLNMTVDTLSSLAKGTKLVNMETIQRLKLQGMHPIFHNLALQQHMTDELQKLAKGGLITPKAEARMQKQLDAVFDVMGAVAGKYDKLVEDGYAPLMRFGHYAVEVRDKVSNDLDLFELYETKGQQRKAIKELKERYDESQFAVGTGTLNPEGFKQFKNKGLSPETVQLFAAELGLDDDSGYQAYLKIAVSDRSALKRLIHRKKVPGYSEDMPRVLSSFVMSNARYSGRGLYNSEIERSIQNIEDGNLQNEAQKVFENIENPQEEFAQQRSLMFHYFMGFSPAFFFLNLTQPFTQTIPKLTAYVGAGKGHAYMAQALGIVGKNMGASAIEMGKKVAGMPTPNWRGFEDKLPAWVKKEDYLRMAREGHLDPQNIYMIKGLERGKGGVASGVWGNIESAAGWFAEVSESMNRRSTMIAAFRVAHDMGDAKLKAKGFDSKYDFAVSIIQQTQGIYNKGNRSGLARGNGKLGQYGPLILVFKQFTINYTEQMIRHGKDKEAKSLAVAMMWQFALAGMLGLPFADDLRDLFEGIAYRVFGKAFNLPDYLEGLLGKSNADALMYGLASEKGRIDLFGRSSLGNIIPGTDVIRPGPTDWAEILGASSGFYESFFSAASMAADGHYKDALITASPRYIRDAASGVEIAMTGSYRNTKGDKIMDLDKTDAVIKSMAFNPSNNARPGRDRSNAYDMKNMLKAKTDYFSKHLAEAIYQENDERLDELYNEMDAWNERNAEHFNVDIDKIEKSAEKRVERKDFGSAERQNIQDSLALRQEDLAGT